MSDLTTASQSLGVPEPLIERSAAARATANGTTADQILAAWAGGAPPAPAPAATEPTPASEPASPPPASETPAVEPEAAAVAVATMEEAPPSPVPMPEPEPEVPLEPVPVGQRVRTAVTIGAWSGAGLGIIGFLIATAFWVSNATVTGEGPYSPAIVVGTTGVLVGSALVSILFGSIVASMSRSAIARGNPAMELSTPQAATSWLGAFVGLVLGVIAGALLTSGFGTVVEGQDGMTQLPMLPTLAIMALGGAILGGLTAAITQAIGVPVAVEAGDEEEIARVKGRLAGALSIPVAGLIILLALVLPFAWALIRSAELSAAGAPVVAVLTAAGILVFASLAGSRPNMRISFGELMVAIIGIGTVIVVILVVLISRGQSSSAADAIAQVVTGI
ncbi:MAG: hypothetical protein WB245_08685 [Acidimicrobiia bacterium]